MLKKINGRLKNVLGDLDFKEILFKGFTFLSTRIFGLIAGYVFTLLTTRYFGAEVYGFIALCFSLFVFSAIIGRLGIDVNLVRFYSSPQNWDDSGLFFRVLLKSIVLSALISLGLYLLREFFSFTVFDKPDLIPYFGWLCLSIPFWSITLVCAGFLRAKKKIIWFAFFNNPGRFVLAVVMLMIMLRIEESSILVIKAHTYGVMLLAIIAFILCVREMGKLSFRTDHNSWQFLKEAFPMMLSSTVLVLLGWLDTFILGIYEEESQIGIYNVALKLAALTSFALQAIGAILGPKLALNFANQKMGQFKKLVAFSAKLNFIVSSFVVVNIILFHKWLLLVFGEEFLAGATVLIVLCLGQLVNAMTGSVATILQMTGNQKVYQNIVLCALLLNIVLNLLLVPKYGVMGAATATVISVAGWNIAGTLYLKRKMKITSYYNFR